VRDQTIQAAYQGRFAGTAGPGDQDNLACLSLKGDLSQRLFRPLAITVGQILYT
jgi:hypothetical protein